MYEALFASAFAALSDAPPALSLEVTVWRQASSVVADRPDPMIRTSVASDDDFGLSEAIRLPSPGSSSRSVRSPLAPRMIRVPTSLMVRL